MKVSMNKIMLVFLLEELMKVGQTMPVYLLHENRLNNACMLARGTLESRFNNASVFGCGIHESSKALPTNSSDKGTRKRSKTTVGM